MTELTDLAIVARAAYERLLRDKAERELGEARARIVELERAEVERQEAQDAEERHAREKRILEDLRLGVIDLNDVSLAHAVHIPTADGTRLTIAIELSAEAGIAVSEYLGSR